MRRFVIFACLFIASAAGAADYSDLYIIPIAGHTRGAFGTEWRTDVVVHNIQQIEITVEMALVESGRAPSTEPIAIPVTAALSPGETRVFADILATQGRDLTGSLIVGAELPFALSSRTYAELATGCTLGQTVTPVAIRGTSNAELDVSILTGSSADEHHRSNIGVFLAASQAPLIAEIALVSANGATVESTMVVVEEPGFSHQQFATRTGLTAIVRIREGDGIAIPYASTIDNITAEAIFISGEPVAAHHEAGVENESSPRNHEKRLSGSYFRLISRSFVHASGE